MLSPYPERFIAPQRTRRTQRKSSESIDGSKVACAGWSRSNFFTSPCLFFTSVFSVFSVVNNPGYGPAPRQTNCPAAQPMGGRGRPTPWGSVDRPPKHSHRRKYRWMRSLARKTAGEGEEGWGSVTHRHEPRGSREEFGGLVRRRVAGLCLFVMIVPLHCLGGEGVGIASHAPQVGRAVEVDGGHMVAYTETVPGTQASFEMMPIPAGILRMGSPVGEVGRRDDEGPQIRVEIDALWMSACEVTWGEYEGFMAELEASDRRPGSAVRPDDPGWADAVSLPSPIYDNIAARGGLRGPRLPVQLVTQYAARQYTKWLSLKTGRFYRLPTEAEWEYACRAGSTGAYAFGNDRSQLGQYAWYAGNSEDEMGEPMPHEVGRKRPNGWDLHDMHGNVAEWVIDVHSPYGPWANRRVSWREIVQWPTRRYGAVVRGGSYLDAAAELRSAARRASDSSWQDGDAELPRSLWWLRREGAFVGFRLVRPLREPQEAEKKQWWDAHGEWEDDHAIFTGRGSLRRIRVDP